MSPLQRALGWVVLVTATLVVIGVAVQVYLIAAGFRGSADAIDAHEVVGSAVHGLEAIVFLAALVAFWRRWVDVGLAAALIVVGTVQIAFVESDNAWVGGLHGLFGVLVLVVATIIAHRAVRHLGLGRHGRMPGAA